MADYEHNRDDCCANTNRRCNIDLVQSGEVHSNAPRVPWLLAVYETLLMEWHSTVGFEHPASL